MNALLASYLSRHYHLTLIALVAGIVALFLRFMSGGEFVALASTAISAFRVGDVLDTWVKGKTCSA